MNAGDLMWYALFVIATGLVVGGVAVAVRLLQPRAASGPRRWLAGVSLAVVVVAAVGHPFVNLIAFKPAQDRAIVAMTAEVGLPVGALVEKYGPPSRVWHNVANDEERWGYWPGPWYAYSRWEMVVYRIHGGRIVGTYIED